jgi:hypothetical protein
MGVTPKFVECGLELLSGLLHEWRLCASRSSRSADDVIDGTDLLKKGLQAFRVVRVDLRKLNIRVLSLSSLDFFGATARRPNGCTGFTGLNRSREPDARGPANDYDIFLSKGHIEFPAEVNANDSSNG